MTHRDDPLADAIAGFRRLPIPDRPADAQILARLAPPVEGPGPTVKPTPIPIRRLLMRPTFRYAVAAATLALCAGWLALVPSSTPALAEVIRATEQHRLLRFQSQQTTDDREAGLTAPGTRTVFVDLTTPRVREEEHFRTFNDLLDFRYTAVYDFARGRFLTLNSHERVEAQDQAPDEQRARLIKMIEDQGLARRHAVVGALAATGPEGIPPMSLLGKGHGFLDSLRRLQAHEQTVATREEREGVPLAKYRLKDGNLTVSLWVDPRTKLPVRMEIEAIDPTPKIARNTWVYTDFAWDPAGADPAALFSTDPPAGYPVAEPAR